MTAPDRPKLTDAELDALRDDANNGELHPRQALQLVDDYRALRAAHEASEALLAMATGFRHGNLTFSPGTTLADIQAAVAAHEAWRKEQGR